MASNKSKTNGHAEPDTLFDDAVSEGKKIVAQIEAAEKGQLRLGELADKLETHYNDRTVAKFAAEVGLAKCTVDRYRTVYRAWKDKIGPKGPNLDLPSYAVLRELATHPDRAKIIQDDPAITKREAANLMRKQNGKSKEAKATEQEDDWLKHNRKWLKELRTLADDAIRIATAVDVATCTPEQLERLADAIEPKSLMYLHGAGRMLFNLANQLAELAGEEVQQFGTRSPVRRAEAGGATDGHAARL